MRRKRHTGDKSGTLPQAFCASGISRRIQVQLLMQCIKVYRPPQHVYVLKSLVILCTFYINNQIISLSVYSFRSVVPYKEVPFIVASYDTHRGRVGLFYSSAVGIHLLSPVPTGGQMCWEKWVFF